MSFDRVHLPRQSRQHSRLVACSRSDLENRVLRFYRQQLCHDRDHVWLRNRLILANGDRLILVRAVASFLRNELMARNVLHGPQHTFIVNTASTELLLHHRPSLRNVWIGFEGLLHVHFLRWRIRTSNPSTPVSSRTPCTERSLVIFHSTWIICCAD